jgi:predicted DNA-binding transcriptional regulator YafY
MAVTSLVERLTTIIHYLNRGEVAHVKELATKFSISERQIQKDIKLFSSFYDFNCFLVTNPAKPCCMILLQD